MVSVRGFGNGFGTVPRRFQYGFDVVSHFGFPHGFGMVSEGGAKPSFSPRKPSKVVVANDMVFGDQFAAVFVE